MRSYVKGGVLGLPPTKIKMCDVENVFVRHLFLLVARLRHCPQADFFLDFFFGVDFFVLGPTTTPTGRKEENVKFWGL